MPQDEYETELTGDRATVAAALSGVVDGLLAGSVRVGDGDDAIVVEIPEELTLEVELETDDDERSLELELEWPAEDADADTDISAAADVMAALEAEPPTESPSEPVEPEQVGEAAESDKPTEETVELDQSPVEVLPVGAGDAVQSLARFELYQDRAEEWRWRLRHRNGNIIATSGEGYTRKHNARKGLQSVVRNAPDAAVGEESE